ncbi:DNA polymerase theta [Nesidiocoris tenuis]|uniref:DNA polymerase theta n=1 Tax=Nesidiocoris tenuis TaxID=355587 RepID=A0ABN7AAG7_9HEMI|nr:DNA polymerase theta [Nesidiocoris tenuis]
MTCQSLSSQEKLNLESWGLPKYIVQKYKSKGLTSMFPWQLECLMSSNVLDGGNLVYSAPTSAGKTLVAEIITLQTVLERKKKVIIILPFVSVVREKMLYFKDLLVGSGIRVEGFMGSYHPPGGFRAVHIAICTIEKANSLINRLMEEKNLENIGCVVVDELHLLGDPHRGYLLELLLTKLRYICKKGLCPPIQIIGMSATLPNLEILSKWLDAALYVTDFRPIPLTEYLKVNRTLLKVPDLTNCGEVVPEFIIDNDPGDVIYLCIDTILKGFSALVFCPTKNWCETLAMQIAREVMRLGCGNEEVSAALRRQLKSEAISDTLDQLKNSPVGLESALGKSISFGVAFHHAGLTLDERDIIEGGFKTGTLRVLVATSTLSAGVNLPARRVIVRSPQFGGSMMDIRTYKQMVGRAGRMGQDTAGESYLLCTDGDKSIGQRLTTSSLPPVESSLGNSDLSNSLKRAILEIIASGLITSYAEVECYTSCTMLAAYEDPAKINEAVQKCVKYLTDKGFIDLKNETEISASSLAEACLSASMSPDQGLTLLAELDKARKNFVLESDLHAVYQVTPFSVSNQWGLDWMKAFSIWEKLPKSTQKVGHLVGVEDRFLIRAMRGSTNFQADSHRVAVHKRFFTALALQDLITEMPLTKVVEKYGCNKGMLQSLQQSASTFSGMVTNFCRKLGWGALEVVVSQLGQRIQFGAHRDLLDLLKLDCLTAVMARSLYNSEITTVADLAQASMRQVEAAIRKALPYASSQENDSEREKKDVSLPGRPGLTVSEAADLFIKEARTYIMREMGVDHVQWNDHHASPDIYDMSTVGPGSRDTTTKDESLNVSVASANFEHVNQSDRRIGLPSTSSVKFDLETKTEDDKSEPELELKLALSEENDGNDEKESEEESGQGSLSSSKFTSLLNISNPCIPKLSSRPASPTSGSVSGDDVGPSDSEDVVPTSQDLETKENVGGKTNRSSVALFLNNSKATPTTKEGLPKDLTDYSNLQISNFSNLFGDSFSRESPVERSKVARFRNGVESSTPIVNKVTSASKTPADSGKGSQSARSPLLFQTPNSAGADFSDGDMFGDSGTHRRLSASMICAINSNQPLDDFDPNWGGDSLLLASQVVESHKKEALNLKRKLAEESPLSNREVPPSKRKCVLSVHKTKAKKCSSRNDSLSTAENSSLNAQQLKIVDLESDPFRLRAEEGNVIEQVDTPPSLKDNKVLPGSRNSLTDSVLAQVFQDSFGPADGKSSDPGTPEMFESPQKRPRAEDSTNIVLKFEATQSRPNQVTAHVSLAQPPSNPTTPTKLNTSPGKYSPLGVSVVKCSRSPRTSPSEKEKSRNGRIDRSKRSQSTCKKLLTLPDNQVDPLKTGQPSGIERLKPNIDTDGKAKKLKKFKSETWGKSDPVESQLITGSTPEACSEPIESQPTKTPITPTKFSGPVDLSKIADVLEICTSGANLEDFLDTVDRRKEMAFCLETTQYSSTESKIGMKVVRSKCPVEKEPDFHDSAVAIVGIYMVVDRKLFHCCLRSSKCICIGKLKMIFRRKDIRLIGYDLSWQIKLLHQCCDIAIDSLLWDVCVADWLLDPRDGKTPLKQLVGT